jgi:hypothetical protein
MAHEPGHLLLSRVGHSASGLTAAQWSEREIDAAKRGDLTFTREDVLYIH